MISAMDCFDFLPTIKDGSIDFILADPPYGTTQCKWDSVLPLPEMWEQFWRVLKPEGSIAVFCSQPFSSVLVSSQIHNFRYEWVWEKSKASNFLDCKKKPLKAHESIMIFCRSAAKYYPQMTVGEPYKARPGKKGTDVYGAVKDVLFRNDSDGFRYPRSVIYFKTAESEGKTIHSTQKPISLCEYLIKTYTLEGDLVLDPCAGSGSSAIAAIRSNRQFVGSELDLEMSEKANNRIKEFVSSLKSC